MSGICRLYDDLSWLWPLWGDPSDYAQWCENITRYIRQYSRIPSKSLLNMACGGGKNAYNLKKDFEVTGLDLSGPMLELAKELNPDCTFVLGDMQTCKLGRQFDAIFIDDGIVDITSLDDFQAVFRNAFEHLCPGGVMIVSPDYVKETFRQNCTRVSEADSNLRPANVEVTFIENEYDPDPTDDTYDFTIVYLIRKDGRLRIETESGPAGLFTLDAWRNALREAGFEVHEEVNAGAYSEDSRSQAPTFVCVKPGGP